MLCTLIHHALLLNCRATENDAGLMEFDEKEADNVNFDRPRSPTRRRKDSYDYANTVRMFGKYTPSI